MVHKSLAIGLRIEAGACQDQFDTVRIIDGPGHAAEREDHLVEHIGFCKISVAVAVPVPEVQRKRQNDLVGSQLHKKTGGLFIVGKARFQFFIGRFDKGVFDLAPLSRDFLGTCAGLFGRQWLEHHDIEAIVLQRNQPAVQAL